MTTIIKIIIIITIIAIQSIILVGLIHGTLTIITDGKNQPESVHWGKDGGLIICQGAKVPRCQSAKVPKGKSIPEEEGAKQSWTIRYMDIGQPCCFRGVSSAFVKVWNQTIPRDKENWIWWCMSMKLGIISNPSLKHKGIPELKSWSESLTWRVFFSIAKLLYPPNMKVLMCGTAKN